MKLLRAVKRSLLLVEDSPERTALSFSLGVFLGFSPFLGLHTLLGLLLAFLFRLNKTAMLVGVYVNNPWVLAPFYAFATWLGVQLLGLPQGTTLPEVSLPDLFHSRFWWWLLSEWRLLIPAFAGSLILCTLFGLLSYPVTARLLRKYRASRRSPALQGRPLR